MFRVIKTDKSLTYNEPKSRAIYYSYFKNFQDIKNAPEVDSWQRLCYTIGVKITDRHMIEGFVLTFALMTFCIGSSMAIVRFASRGGRF